MAHFGRALRNIVGLASSPGSASIHPDECEEVRLSGLFDGDWYLRTYPDVAAEAFDPLLHYMIHGWRESRNPNLLFETNWYLEHYPDVRAAGLNPLVHYIRHGAGERRDTGPRFRPSIFQDEGAPRGPYHLAAALAYLRKIAPPEGEHHPDLLGTTRVLIIAELSIPQCRRYRVEQKRELLSLQGYDSTVLNWHDAERCEAALALHSMVIFYRVPAADSMLRCIEKARLRICNLQSLGGCLLRVSRICPHSPTRRLVVLYRVSQGRTLH